MHHSLTSLSKAGIYLTVLLLGHCKIPSKTISSQANSAWYVGPIIDMHLHADELEEYGGGIANCSNKGRIIFPPWDPKDPLDFGRLAICDSMIPPASSDRQLMLESIDMLDRYNIYAVTSGKLETVKEWQLTSPQRIIPALSFTSASSKQYTLEDFRSLYQSGEIKVFAENGPQYHGLRVDDQQYDQYFSLAAELDIPVAVHLGEGPTGGAHFLGDSKPSKYRVALTNPFVLEKVLIKYPNLRIYVMHYASPLVEEMLAMLYSHPQLYVDIAQNNWGHPKDHFYDQLRRLIDAGFEKRILWGSDQMIWPKAIEIAIETIQEAPFLNPEQKADIFYNNAARFLRLTEEEIAKHHQSK